MCVLCVLLTSLEPASPGLLQKLGTACSVGALLPDVLTELASALSGGW